MRKPRLKQPLFSKEHGELYNKAAEDKLMMRLVMAYDSIWSLLYDPRDMPKQDIETNAEANLNNLGQIIENVLGSEVFDTDPQQLSFREDILNPKN